MTTPRQSAPLTSVMMRDSSAIEAAPPEGKPSNWLVHHPALSFPPEHAIGELTHQVDILRGAENAAGTVAMGTAGAPFELPAATTTTTLEAGGSHVGVTSSTSSDPTATAIAVGVALDAEGVALPTFLGSGMAREHHRPRTSAVDLESLGLEADGLAEIFIEGYSELYHRVKRFNYPAEAVPPSDAAMRRVNDEYATLMAAASVACRAHRANIIAQAQPAGATGGSEALQTLGCAPRLLFRLLSFRNRRPCLSCGRNLTRSYSHPAVRVRTPPHAHTQHAHLSQGERQGQREAQRGR